MLQKILHELRHHIPFTFLGAIIGISAVYVFRNIPFAVAHQVFYVAHPLHVLLGALITGSMYKIHVNTNPCRNSLVKVLLVGYIGAVGIATLSDSLIPYACEILLGLPLPELHLGFVEKWWVVNPIAIIGILLAYHWPSTKLRHSFHILVSTFASLMHIVMAMGKPTEMIMYVYLFFFLFLAVWIPCCTSDIVIPLLFTGKIVEPCVCHCKK